MGDVSEKFTPYIGTLIVFLSAGSMLNHSHETDNGRSQLYSAVGTGYFRNDSLQCGKGTDLPGIHEGIGIAIRFHVAAEYHQ